MSGVGDWSIGFDFEIGYEPFPDGISFMQVGTTFKVGATQIGVAQIQQDLVVL